MTRRDRDWNRPIPQRQQNNTRPSALLRGVAGDMLPAQEAEAPPSGGMAIPEFDWDAAFNRALHGRQMGRSDTNAERLGSLFGSLSTGALTNFISNTTASTLNIASHRFSGTATAFAVPPRLSPMTLRERYEQVRDVTYDPNQRVRLNAEGDISFREPVTLRLRANIPEYSYALLGSNTLTATAVNAANSEYSRLVQQAAEDIGRRIARSVEASNGNSDGFSRDFEGDSTYYVDPHGRGLGAMSQAFNRNPSIRDLAQENLCQEIPLPTESEEKRYTLEEIKEWLKKSLEVKTQIFESDGEVSVTTTLLLDGEEFSSDEDSTTIG